MIMQTQKKPKKRSTRSNRYNDDRVDYNLEEEIASNSAKTWKNTFKIKNSFKLNDVHGSFVKLLELKETKMVFADGPAGTGKTYLAVLAALELLQLKSIDNIVYIRSIVESASRSMGSLPGELQDKFMPWALPLIEKLDELVGPVSRTELLKSDVVKCLPVNIVRGLTFRNSLVIVDEAQNLTHTELVAILTRFGENTKYVVIGDTRQSDIYNKSGYLGILNLFNDEQSQDKGIHVFKFGESEIVRSKILKFIVQKLETLQPTYSESQDYRAHKQKSHSAPVVPPQMTPYGQYPEEWQVTPLCEH